MQARYFHLKGTLEKVSITKHVDVSEIKSHLSIGS